MIPFIDRIAITQRHPPGVIFPGLAGMRTISYRRPGDVQRDGTRCAAEDDEAFNERAFGAWLHGSHETRLQLLAEPEDRFIGLRGNPGRFGRADNVFNLDLQSTVARCNEIVQSEGMPVFHVGEWFERTSTKDRTQIDSGWTGARIWELHLTCNYATGSASNAKAVHRWLDGQSMARVKKARFGSSTITWGSIKYAQTEFYIKADELLSHRKASEQDDFKKTDIYQFLNDNGVVRFEVKLSKNYLNQHALTYLGAWNMAKVIKLFEDRTEIIRRQKVDIEEFDINALPRRLQLIASAWMAGQDVTHLVSRATLFRHAKSLRDYGIDIAEPRNVAAFPIRLKTIELQPLAMPEWYSLKAA